MRTPDEKGSDPVDSTIEFEELILQIEQLRQFCDSKNLTLRSIKLSEAIDAIPNNLI